VVTMQAEIVRNFLLWRCRVLESVDPDPIPAGGALLSLCNNDFEGVLTLRKSAHSKEFLLRLRSRRIGVDTFGQHAVHIDICDSRPLILVANPTGADAGERKRGLGVFIHRKCRASTAMSGHRVGKPAPGMRDGGTGLLHTSGCGG